jgi:hypothetical protein
MTTTQDLITQDGVVTTLSVTPTVLGDTLKTELQAAIKNATKAKENEFTDVTPMYWEARQGDTKIMALMGFKPINKKDEKTGEVIGQDFAAVFFDGDREIVCNQIALKDAVKNKPMGKVYKITCIQAIAKQAKKFTVLEFNA